MSRRHAEPARLPPPDLPGLDPSWSRLVPTTDADGVRREWHVLDSGAESGRLGTLLCVHGNPTWSYLWRRLVAAPPAGWRVVAPDQLGMGWSERLEAPRSLAQRVDDLGRLTDALDIDGPVITVAHDWGGPISMGWALGHLSQLRGVVLTNTGVNQPADAAVPALIRLARSGPLLDTVCVRTPVFVRATTALSRPALPAEVRDAFAAPYATASRRQGVGDFVSDIPLEPGHPSAAALDGIRDGLDRLADVPALLLWGPRDPVFAERYLRDLLRRLPQADVHRFEGASHLVAEDAPQATEVIARWVAELDDRPLVCPAVHAAVHAAAHPAAHSAVHPVAAPSEAAARPPWAALTDRADDPSTAIVELGGSVPRRVSFARLEQRVSDLATGLSAAGVEPGHRVALLVPPGADLAATLYACWRVGAVVVVADAGLGARSLGRALRGAGPDHVIGIPRGLAASAALRVPGRRIAAGPVSHAERLALRVAYTLDELADLGRRKRRHQDQESESGRTSGPDARISPLDLGWSLTGTSDDSECAILFTSGATGPSKGVVYRSGQVRAQLEALRSTYGITSEDRLVAAFAPFALYGPLLGIASVVPDVDVTAPAGLTAVALAEAVAAVDATLVFASPSALRNVVETAADLSAHDCDCLARVRLVLSAGAPVPASLLRSVGALMPSASLHTPYGMTEVLPVADISLAQIDAAGEGNGVCVGRPVAGVEVGISRLTADGVAAAPPSPLVDVPGEICVRAAHRKDRYDRLWATERDSSRDPGWHRTSDVGHLDPDGRLWVEGRLAHIVVTAAGVVTPVGVEQRIESLPVVRSAALVGVGPRGTQQPVAVVVPRDTTHGVLAPVELAAAVRAGAGVELAAVLVTPRLPVDIRHESKIDRARVSAWAERVLSGGHATRTP